MTFSLTEKIKNNLQYIVLLVLLTLVAYGTSLNNQFIWDDEQFIYSNNYVKQFDIKKIFTENTIAGAGQISTYYRPLTSFSFAVDHAIWGLNPFGFHLTNTLLHLGAGILLFLYLTTLGFSKKISIIIAGIFIVHPIQTEAVVYANSRGDSMYVFWAMISLISFALLLKNKIPKITIYDFELKLSKQHLFGITLFAYLLSILGKEIGIATVGLLYLTYVFVHSHSIFSTQLRHLVNKQHILSTLVLPFSAITAISYLFLRTKFINIASTQENYFIGTSYGESLYVRLHTFTKALFTYFQLLIFPYPLHMERTLEIIENPVSIYLIGILLLFILLMVLTIKEYKKHKSVYIAFGSLWFLGMLIPVSGIIPINGLIYEHWLYMPIIGFLIAVYGVKNTVLTKRVNTKFTQILQNSIPILFFVYIALTIRQNYIWKNPIRFYSYTLQFNETARLRNNLAMAHAEASNYSLAIENYQRAIEVGDFYPNTHHNLANAYVAIGATDLAIESYKNAIKMNKNFMPAYIPLIQILLQQKDYENAAYLVKYILEINPNNLEVQYKYAQIQAALGNTIEAKEILEKLIRTENLSTQFKLIIKETMLQLKQEK